MSLRTARLLTAFCGVVGTALLAAYFLAAPPLPAPNASVTDISSVAAQYHNTWYLGAWIQALGSTLSLIFFLALVYLSGASTKFTGILTQFGSAVLLSVTLIEGAFTIELAQAALNGHAETSVTSYDLMGVFVHIFPLAPAPLILIPLGIALYGSRLLPRALAVLALALGGLYIVVGLAGLFSTPLLTLIPLGLQALWVLTAGIILAVTHPATVQPAAITI
jgi:hypothetical protein